MSVRRTHAGLRFSRRSRATGTRVGLYNSVEAGLDAGSDGDGAWSLVCEDHAGVCAFPSRRQAEYHLPDPSLWCDSCRVLGDLRRVRAIFARLRAEVRGADPDFDVVLDVDDAAGEPCCRQFAYCESVTPARIAVAAKLETENDARIEGILRHEFGHAVLFFAGRLRHTEREADAAAERLWGDPIRYDTDDVQTLGPGVSPRPAHLG